MTPKAILALRHACCRIIATAFSLIRLHHIDFLSIGETPVVRKRRRWYAKWMILCGNRFLKETHDGVVVLPTTDWIQWERTVDHAMRRGLILPESSNFCCLVFRQIPGNSLRQVLCNKRISPEQQFRAIRWSLVALRALHQTALCPGRNCFQSISHGDATANNVIVDCKNSSATWIDFDMRHQPTMPDLDRQTDDLRAFVFSVAAFLPAASYAQLTQLIHLHVNDFAVIAHFQQRLKNEWADMSIFQLAQAPLRWAEAETLRKELLHLPHQNGMNPSVH
jgi:serine/threonine protein kinase